MREHKYRAWDGNNNVMWIVTDIQWNDRQGKGLIAGQTIIHIRGKCLINGILTPIGCNKRHSPKRFKNIILMESTGLILNKVEVFEGDLIGTGEKDDGRPMIVAYSNGLNSFLGMGVGWFLHQDDFARWTELEFQSYDRVVGNIYKNKDLMED